MEGVGKCGGGMRSVLGCGESEGRCRRCGEVWGRSGRVYGVSVEIEGKCVGMS